MTPRPRLARLEDRVNPTPAFDLRGQAFAAVRERLDWGGTTSVRFALTNAGTDPSPAAAYAVVLAADGDVRTGTRLATVAVPPLAPDGVFADTLAVTLPARPAGEDAVQRVFDLAGLLDPDGLLPDADPNNDAGLGRGLDRAGVSVGDPARPTTYLSIAPPAAVAASNDKYQPAILPLSVPAGVRIEELSVGVELTVGPASKYPFGLTLITPAGDRLPLGRPADPAPGPVRSLVFTPAAAVAGRFDSRTETRPLGDFAGQSDGTAAGTWQLEVKGSPGDTLLTSWWLDTTRRLLRPNLAVGGVSVAEPTLAWGGPATVTFTVTNAGPVASPASTAAVVFGSDVYLTAADAGVGAVELQPLAPGESVTLTRVVTLPPKPTGFPFAGAAVTLGVVADRDGLLSEVREDDNGGERPGVDTVRRAVANPLARTLSDTADTVTAYTSLTGSVTADTPDEFALSLTEAGRLTVSVAGPATVGAPVADPRVQVFTAAGVLLLQSDDKSAADPTAWVRQQLPAGDYRVRVTAQGGHGGEYALTTSLDESPGLDPFPVAPGFGQAVIPINLNGDRFPDLVGVGDDGYRGYAGLGDGTFRQVWARPSGRFDFIGGKLFAADVNGDGRDDLIIVGGPLVTVLFGQSDGTLAAGQTTEFSYAPQAVAVGDFDGDGHADLAVGSAGLIITFDPTGHVGHLTGSSTDPVLLVPGTARGFGREAALPVAGYVAALTAADLTGDGRPELIVGLPAVDRVEVLLNDGRGRFTPGTSVAVGEPGFLAVADFTGDGLADLAVAEHPIIGAGDLGFGLYAGDGFGGLRLTGHQPRFPLVSSLTAADLNADGRPDLVGNNLVSDGSFLRVIDGPDGLGQPAGSQLPALPLADGTGEVAAVVDFDADGFPDYLAVGDQSWQVVLARAGGEPVSPTTYRVATEASRLVAGDLNRDGVTDLIPYAPSLPYGVRAAEPSPVLLGRPGGTFVTGPTFDGAPSAVAVALADVNGDGRLDAVAVVGDRAGGAAVVVLPGRGDGGFASGRTYPIAAPPEWGGEVVGLTVTDLDGDGALDVALCLNSYYYGSDDSLDSFRIESRVSVLLGRGDGSFEPAVGAAAGGPIDMTYDRSTFGAAMAVVDATGDGRPDLVYTPGTNPTGVVFVLSGGRLLVGPSLTFPDVPLFLRTADLSGDGRAELVMQSAPAPGEPTAQIYSLALGADGRLLTLASSATSRNLLMDIVADVDGDGRADVVLTSEYDYSGDRPGVGLRVLRGDGRGGFGRPVDTGTDRTSGPVVADVNQDGQPDLLGVDLDTHTLTVFLGRPDGFTVRQLPAGAAPPDPLTDGFATGLSDALDLNGDGRPDPVGSFVHPDGTLDVTLSAPGGGATVTHLATSLHIPYDGGDTFVGVVVGDLTGDGRPDVAAGGLDSSFAYASTVFVWPGRGDGTFDPPSRYVLQGVNARLGVLYPADINADGLPDLVVHQAFGPSVALVGTRFGLTAAPPDRSPVVAPAPAAADVDGDGVADLVSVDVAGRVYVRHGLGGGSYNSPQLLNPIRSPRGEFNGGQSATDVAVFDRTSGGGFQYRIVTLGGDGLSAYNQLGFGALSGRGVDGATRLVGTRLAALDGSDDLLMPDTLGDALGVLTTGPDIFTFSGRTDLPTGTAPIDVAVADLDGDGRPDLVTLNRYSGDLSVLLNRYQPSQDQFATTHAGDPPLTAGRFRAVPGVAGSATVNGGLTVRALEQPTSFALGDFDAHPGPDAVVVQAAAGRAYFVSGSGAGGFVNPDPASAIDLGPDPGPVVTGDFDHDGHLDFAVLVRGAGAVRVWRGDGGGHFLRVPREAPVGAGATGLTAHDLDGDGTLDLLVGNEFGDVLVLHGAGDGTFAPDRPPTEVPLAVADLNGDGLPDVVLANQTTDEVRVALRQPDGTFAPADRVADPGKLLTPSAVTLFDLNRDGQPELIVPDAGANSVAVYPGTGPGAFGPPTRYFVGSGPAGVTVADLNGDGTPDLAVPNAGSNDVSVLLGRISDGTWTAEAGPRLASGGAEPTQVTVRDQNQDGRPDLVVYNRGSGDLAVLPSVGGGFFRDDTPRTLQLGGSGDGAPPPSVDPVSGRGVADVPGRGIMAFDLTTFAPPTLVFDPGLGPLAGLQSVRVGGADGLVLTASDGRLTVLSSAFAVLAAGFAGAGPPVSASVATAAGSGVDVYLTRQGSSVPELLTLGLDGGTFQPPPLPPQPPPVPGGSDESVPAGGGGGLVARFDAGLPVAELHSPAEPSRTASAEAVADAPLAVVPTLGGGGLAAVAASEPAALPAGDVTALTVVSGLLASVLFAGVESPAGPPVGDRPADPALPDAPAPAPAPRWLDLLTDPDERLRQLGVFGPPVDAPQPEAPAGPPAGGPELEPVGDVLAPPASPGAVSAPAPLAEGGGDAAAPHPWLRHAAVAIIALGFGAIRLRASADDEIEKMPVLG